MSDKHLLIGAHGDTQWTEPTSLRARGLGYEVRVVSDLACVLDAIGERDYDNVLMDANLGDVGGADIDPARETYKPLERRIESGETMILFVSNNPLAVESCRTEGLPAITKDRMGDVMTSFLARDRDKFYSDLDNAS